MSRRALTLAIAAVGAAGALIVAAVIPVPYVALLPGPTYNTLGLLDGKPVIQISGHRTFPAGGHLNMVTISYIGGPGASPPFTIFAALAAWLTPHEAVVPQSELFPPGKTQQQVIQQDTEEMASSQQAATAAALCQLGIGFATIDTIASTVPGMPAARALRPGDVIKAVDGRPVTCRRSAAAMIGGLRAGQRLVLTVERKGGRVNVIESFRFPFTVKINVGNIGGPSAGLMFALGIIDKLTPANLAGGRFIAGTGEITVSGQVGPIGGIQQKMAAARAAGATIFLTPAANCPDTAGAVPPGLRLVKVSTLRGAIAALRALKRGRPVPTC